MEKEIDIKKDVVSFQQAIDLCVIGFTDKTLCAYDIDDRQMYMCHLDEDGLYMPDKDISAPFKSQVFRWFREKYGIFNPQNIIFQTMNGRYGIESVDEHDQVDGYFDTYEEAENTCIDKLIELAKQQENGK